MFTNIYINATSQRRRAVWYIYFTLRSNKEYGLYTDLIASSIVFCAVARLMANEVVSKLFQNIEMDTFNVCFILIPFDFLTLFVEFIYHEAT